LQVNWEVECNKAKSSRWLSYYFKRGTVYTQCKIYTYTCSKDISENWNVSENSLTYWSFEQFDFSIIIWLYDWLYGEYDYIFFHILIFDIRHFHIKKFKVLLKFKSN